VFVLKTVFGTSHNACSDDFDPDSTQSRHVHTTRFIFLPRLILLTATLGGLSSAATQAGDLTLDPYAYKLENGQVIQAELGRLVVLQSRSDPTGPVVSLAFVRFRATRPNPGSPIIYLVGGPGASGIDDGRGALFKTIDALRAISDVLLLDQRGTGLSTPDLTSHKSIGVSPGESIGSEQSLTALVETFRGAASEVASRKIDLNAYNTVESAEDVEDLRKALGVATVRIWAHSYGTHLALAFLRQHPASVEKVILGGINGPDQRWRLPADLDRLFAKLDTLVRADPRWKDRIPDLPALVRNVLTRLESKPVSVPLKLSSGATVTVVLGKQDVQVLTALQMGDIDFIAAIPALYYAMSLGDFTQPAFITLALKTSEIGTAMRYAMHCASGVSAERLDRIRSEAGAALFGDSINFPFSDPRVCQAWAVKDLGPSFRAPVTSKVPALFVSATLDGRTSMEDTEEVRAGFSDSRRVILEGSSHGRMFSTSADLTALMVSFFDGRPAPSQTITIPFQFISVPSAAGPSNANAASLQTGSVAVESIVSAFGTSLATTTASATGAPLPTNLGGTTVVVKDATGTSRSAPLFYVSSGQVNYQVPAGTSSGNATVTIASADGTTSSAALPISTIAPGLFALTSDGLAAATVLRVKAGGVQSGESVFEVDPATNQVVPSPIDLGPPTDQVYLILFGTGFRFNQGQVSVELAGSPTSAQYAGPQGFFAGLDQMNLLLSRSLAGLGRVPIRVVVDGVAANMVNVTIR